MSKNKKAPSYGGDERQALSYSGGLQGASQQGFKSEEEKKKYYDTGRGGSNTDDIFSREMAKQAGSQGAPLYLHLRGKKEQAPSYGGGNADQGYFQQGKGVDQAAAQSPSFKREGGQNPELNYSPATNDNRFNALSQQGQQNYGGMNRDLVASLGNSQGTQPVQPAPASTAPGSEQVVDQDYVGDNGQTRTNMGELSNDEWLKRMNIAQPSSDQTSLRTDIESAAPVDGDPVESRIQTLMQRRGMTREEATANQESAVSQGGDFNNDGAVSNEEWSQFKNGGEQPPMEQPPVEQAPMGQAPQNNFVSGFQDFINQPQVQEFIDQASSKKSSSPPQYGGGMMGGRQGGMMGGMRGSYGGGGIMGQQSPSSYGSYGGGYRPDRPQYQGQQYGGGGGYSTGNYGAPRQYTPQERQSLPGNMAPEDRYPDPAMDNSGYNGYGRQYRYDPRFNVPSF
jgi:hypothetical protein